MFAKLNDSRIPSVVYGSIATPTAVALAGGKIFTAVCLCVCPVFRTISQKPIHLESPNLT